MKRHEMSEWVKFLKWINAETLGIVTDTAVYHWSTEGLLKPRKMFDIESSLACGRIIDYRCDNKLHMLLLVGYSLLNERRMQLYSAETNVNQILNGHTAVFAQFKVKDNPEPSTLLCYSVKTPQRLKLYIKEFGQPPSDHQPYPEKAVDVHLLPVASNDLPKEMQTSSKHGIIYLITRSGCVHLYDVETASLIYRSRMSYHDILVTVPHEATSGIIGVNDKGQVLSVSVDENNLIPYIKNVLKNPDLALRMAVRNNLPGAEDLFLQKFNTLRSHGQYAEAEKFAQNAPQAYSAALCKMGVTVPTGETSTEEQRVKRKVPSSLFLSKEAGKAGTSGLPVVREENRVLEDFTELFFNKEGYDVVLEVKGETFPAHKLILKTRSPVFAATFLKDTEGKSTDIVKIEDCDPSSFSNFLYFLYWGDGTCISEENVFDLFKAADKYDVKDLRFRCLNFMKENLSEDTFSDTLVIALQHCETELHQLTSEFFIKNALSIVLTAKLESVLRENPVHGNELLIKLLKSNKDLNI